MLRDHLARQWPVGATRHRRELDSLPTIRSLMDAAGLDVRIDAAGNLIRRREGTDRELPTIVVGSHADSVIVDFADE